MKNVARARWALGCTLLLWVVLQLLFARPPSIAPFWRQAETQSMALNMAERDFSLLYPQINWGGDGPGYVEAELPIYQALVAPWLSLTHSAEWPGQVLSVLSMALSALVLFILLERRFGTMAAALGALYVLSSLLGVHLSTAVMPDALCGLFYLVALDCFLRYFENEKVSALVLSSVALALASAIKPTALHLGLAQFSMLLMARPDLLRRPTIWAAWGATLLVVGAYLAHSLHIYTVYGNGFGVVSGADSKFPALADLLSKTNLYNLMKTSLTWGVGVVPLLLGLFTLLCGYWTALELSLAIANLFALLISLRYSMLEWAGGHYHLFAMFFGALLVAHAAAHFTNLWRTRARLVYAGYALGFLLLAGQYQRSLRLHHEHDGHGLPAPIVEIAKQLAPLLKPGDLVVMQSDQDAWDPEWKRPDNYQDPRGFYVAHTRGWVLAHDRAEPETLARLAARGARYYVVPGATPETLQGWLAKHASVAYAGIWGKIYRFPVTTSR